MIPYGKHTIDQDDISEVIKILQSDFLTQGPTVELFENNISDYIGCNFSVAVSNATAALHILNIAFDLGPGDELWTSPNTFVATANSAIYTGAKVDFVDIDPLSYCMDVNLLEQKLLFNKKNGLKLPKIVTIVHFSGHGVNLDKFFRLSREYGFFLIEDASHAIGGEFEGLKIGNGIYSDASVFSFHPVKIITTGEGGVITTNNEKLAQNLKKIRSHGVTRIKAQFSKKEEGDWYYEMQDIGFNYRLSDIHCALGISQIKKIDKFILFRKKIADYYDLKLKDIPVITPWRIPNGRSSLHLYVIKLAYEDYYINRVNLYNFMKKNGIGVNVHYIPVHLQPYYQNLGFRIGDFPIAENYYKLCLSLPIFPNLKIDELDYIIETLYKFFKN